MLLLYHLSSSPGGRYHPRRAVLLQAPTPRAVPRHRGRVRPRRRGDGRLPLPPGRAVRARAHDPTRHRRRERRGQERRGLLLPEDGGIVQEPGGVVLRAGGVPARYGVHHVAGREEHIQRPRGGAEARARAIVGPVRAAGGARRGPRRDAVRGRGAEAIRGQRPHHRPVHPNHAGGIGTEPMGVDTRSLC